MGTYILIGLLILFIATVTAAYFGARTWHWAHVTLVVFVFLATVGFLILSAEVLRINAVLRKRVNDLQKNVADVDAKINALEHGTDDGAIIGQLSGDEVKIPEEAESIPSLSDLDHELHLATRLRGRAWSNVVPAGFIPQTNTVQATIESPVPSGMAANTIVYLFEAGEPALPDSTKGRQFLGEFRVDKVTDEQVSMIAVNQLDDFEQKRLAASQGPWAIYETMPVDRHEIFAGLSEEQLRKWIPEQSVQEYIRQGSTAGPDDDEWHRAWFDEEGNRLGAEKSSDAAKTLYERRLRDYAAEFEELARERVVLLADIAGVLKDNERLKLALDSAKKLGAFREDEIAKLSTDLAGVKKERQLIEAHLAAVQQELATAHRWLDEALAENLKLSRKLSTLQAQAAERNRSSAAPVDGPLAVTQ